MSRSASTRRSDKSPHDGYEFISTIYSLHKARRLQIRSATLIWRSSVSMGTDYKHLSCEEHTLIQLSLEQSCTRRVIARSLQWASNWISRELKRKGATNPTTGPRKRGRTPLAGGYGAPLAQQRAAGLARTARCPSRLVQDGPLWIYVARLLRDRHSPEQISGILCQMQPDDPTL